MNKTDKKTINEDIRKAKLNNLETIITILGYCIEAGIHSILAFGISHDVTKDVINIWIENYRIFHEENYLFNLLKKRYNEIDLRDADDILDDLDVLYEKTIPYYYKVLDHILDAAEMKEAYRATREKREFKTLIETDEYRKRLELS